MTGPLSELASEAYVFGFPLVFNGEQILRLTTTGIGSLPPASFNSFSHARSLADPRDTFVSINNDTVYSIAPVDLSVGPILLSVPDAGDRYYVLQFVDAWTNNFAYLGTRATGNGRGDFLLVPPEWEGGPEGDGVTVIRFPTRIATIVGRWACDGEEDLAAVEELQNSLALTPIRKSLTPPQGMPVVAGGLGEALDFFERFRTWAIAFPPAERDRTALDSYSVLGLTSAYTLAEAPEEVRQALEAGYAAGKQALEMAVRTGDGPVVNNWQVNLHIFDYNIDFFEVGALDDPAWKHTDAKTRYATRAAAALGGLWGNHGYEAAYFFTYLDAAGDALTGEHTYTLRLHPTPPVRAFWSITMYDLPNFYLVENEAARYSIGDRTRGIVYDDDGGLTITMSTTRPTDPTAAANWLPTPQGAFRPIMRLYAPEQILLDGGYEVPAIERVD
ncbi:DUF1254 domain-containing protein [Leifsonia sp. PS1209]|uniref:DUF1254 domain-containing protein n=1 Tax=Leifsonia sp. PS1209 TaxID=2724914 RepID=UPI001442AC41|nr:DUF1254 domain-containing protein [Leifsonia sp. PS1209]QIZ97835.1 DUF1254 domain-containing protein [Leifsonia sp. PS1209]